MITCHLRYVIDPYKLPEIEHYGKLWIPLVEKFGGQHHGYLLPSEGANNIAYAMFSFASLSAYEAYRTGPESGSIATAYAVEGEVKIELAELVMSLR